MVYDPSHREANKIEFFYQGGVINDLGGSTYSQNARIAYILDTCGRRVDFTYRSNNTLEKITWIGDSMERTITYQQEVFDAYEGSQKYILSQVKDAAGRITGYTYLKHEVRFSFGGPQNSPISGTMTNYYADLTDVFYNLKDENYTNRLHVEYSNPEEYIKLFGQDHPGAGEKEGFLWYYKVKSRWEEDISRRICRKVSFSYQGEAYRATTPEVFEGTGVIGYQTTVDHYLSEGGLDTGIWQEKYGYHVDKHFLLRHYRVRAEGIEDMNEYTYDDRKCPTKHELYRKKTTSGTYQKISEHTYSYDQYKDLIEEINEENVRTTYLYHSIYHHLIRKEIKNNCNAENILHTHLWTWVIDPSFGDIVEQRQHRGGDSSTYLITWKKSYDQTLGTLIRQEDALGHVTTYEYDSLYHAYPTKIIIHMTATDQEDSEDIIEQYSYYPHGLKKTFTNAQGYTTSYTYDQVDRLLKETYPDNSFQETIYDDVACTTEVIDEEGHKVKEYFDGLGNMVKEERYLKDKATVYSQKSFLVRTIPVLVKTKGFCGTTR